jgi:hypothetical protein
MQHSKLTFCRRIGVSGVTEGIDTKTNFKVIVGPSAKQYVFLQDTFVAKSEYFKRALGGEFQERSGVIRMENTDEKIFTLFVSYVYSPNGSISLPQKPGETPSERLHKIFQLYGVRAVHVGSGLRYRRVHGYGGQSHTQQQPSSSYG